MIEWFEEDFADFSDGIVYDSSEFSNLIKGSTREFTDTAVNEVIDIGLPSTMITFLPRVL